MVLLLTDTKPSITRSVLTSKNQKVAHIQIDSPSFPSSLEAALKQGNLELAVIECRIREKVCLQLIRTIKKRRMDVPVFFVVSADTDQSIAEAFQRGARDCFRNPFDLKLFKERVRTIQLFKRSYREWRVPILTQVNQDSDGTPLSSGLPENVVRVLSFIEDHTNDRDLTLSRLARVAGMSPFHFCRCFKKHTSHSPMQYVTKLRIERAKIMLKYHSRSMSVSQIAATLGFYDSSNLNRHFKRLTGLTPTEFINTQDISS